jgi:hypothetical protein
MRKAELRACARKPVVFPSMQALWHFHATRLCLSGKPGPCTCSLRQDIGHLPRKIALTRPMTRHTGGKPPESQTRLAWQTLAIRTVRVELMAPSSESAPRQQAQNQPAALICVNAAAHPARTRGRAKFLQPMTRLTRCMSCASRRHSGRDCGGGRGDDAACPTAIQPQPHG